MGWSGRAGHGFSPVEAACRKKHASVSHRRQRSPRVRADFEEPGRNDRGHLEEEGLVPLGIRASYENGIRDAFRPPSMVEWLSEHESYLHPDTVTDIRGLLDSGDS